VERVRVPAGDKSPSLGFVEGDDASHGGGRRGGVLRGGGSRAVDARGWCGDPERGSVKFKKNRQSDQSAMRWLVNQSSVVAGG